MQNNLWSRGQEQLSRWRSKLTFFLIFALSISATVLMNTTAPALSQTAAPSNAPTGELRGVWLTNVDSDVLFSHVRLSRAIEKLAELNFNTLYPTVWNWGYTLYPSQVAQDTFGVAVDPRIPELALRDTIADAISLGHDRGLSVIPWFEFGFMTDASSELAAAHPEWITQRRDGSVIWQDTVHQRLWLNPFLPEVQDFILQLILEVVDRYELDGIQFDDHFGLPDEFGYDVYTVQLYKQEHQDKEPPEDSENPDWIKWRAGKITTFMNRVSQAIKSHKPDIVISLSPNHYIYAYTHFLQDWRFWEQQNYVQELVVQLYRDSITSLQTELNQPELQAARQHIPTAIGVLAGLKNKPVAIDEVWQQVQTVRQAGFAGTSLFFYETLWNLSEESEADRQSVLRALFTQPIDRPRVGSAP